MCVEFYKPVLTLGACPTNIFSWASRIVCNTPSPKKPASNISVTRSGTL